MECGGIDKVEFLVFIDGVNFVIKRTRIIFYNPDIIYTTLCKMQQIYYIGSIKVKWDNFEGQHSKLSEKVVTNHTQMAKLSAKSL